MTKHFFFTLAILALAAATAFSQVKDNDAIAKQLKALKADKTFEIITDGAANNSKILGFSDDFGKDETRRHNLKSFRFGLACSYAGRAISSAPDIYLLTFQAGTKKDVFKASHALSLNIDGRNLDLGDARYGNKNEGIEYLNFKLTREQLAKIAGGKTIQMTLGGDDFTLKPKQIKMFANLLAVSDPTKF